MKPRQLAIPVLAALGLGLTAAPLRAALAEAPFDNSGCTPDCYVSPAGDDQTGDGTPASPWASLVKCFNEIDPGDTCWFEDGTYWVPNGSSSGSCSSFDQGWDLGNRDVTSDPDGTTCPGSPGPTCLDCAPFYVTRVSGGGTVGHPKTFRAVHTGEAIWKRDLAFAGGANLCHSNMLIRGSADNLVFRGFVFANQQWIFESGVDNVELTENTYMCGASNDGSNNGVLLTGDNTGPNMHGWWIHNNRFLVDGTCADTSTCNGAGHGLDVAFHHLYSLNGAVHENNDYVCATGAPYGCGDALGFKSMDQGNTIRYNYVEVQAGATLEHGIWISNDDLAPSTGGNLVYQNIVTSKGTGTVESAVFQGEGRMDGDQFYNNTFYGVGSCYAARTDGAPEYGINVENFNNICTHSTGTNVLWFDSNQNGTFLVQDQAVLDWNLYETIGGGDVYRNGTATSTGLAAWQAYLTGLGVGANLDESASRAADPLLVDPAGGDFHLAAASPARSGGRGGSHATVLGAYISGSETIGCTFDPACFGFGGSPFSPFALAVDSAGNHVLDPNETAVVAPSWRNTGDVGAALTGVSSNFTGPAGPSYGNPDALADYGAIAAGSAQACLDCYLVHIAAGTRPARHWDATLDETVSPSSHPAQKTWTLHVGSSFSDVSPDASADPFYASIETIFHHAVTAGCGDGTTFCPLQSNLRQEMAVFLLKASRGSDYLPPPCSPPGVFADVACPSPYADWIEDLKTRGITAGCGDGSTFCPSADVLRQEMAVFLLKTLLGSDYVPPPCAPPGVFTDVACPSPYADWIEDLKTRGITAGCADGSTFCPAGTVTRQEMAAFLTVTFGLVLYGP